MFSTLRQNTQIYILDKQDSPVLKKGTVVSVSPQRPRTGTYYGQPMDMVVDIDINLNGSNESFKNIPANLSIANDGNIVISETKEAMSTEVDAMLNVSRQIIDSVPYHEKVIKSCDEILKELNPQFAKEKAQEDKINSLESRMGGIESSIMDMKDMLSKVLTKA